MEPMRRLRSTFLLTALVACGQPQHGPLCDVRPAHSENALEYVQTLVRSLSVANAAVLRYDQPYPGNPMTAAQAFGSLTQQILDLKHLNDEYQCSADMVKGYQESEMRFVRAGASGIYGFLHLMILLNTKVIEGLKAAVSHAGEAGFDAGEFADEMTNIRLKIDHAYETLPTIVQGSLYALAEWTPESDDKPPSRLIITAREKRELVALVDREFPMVNSGSKRGTTTSRFRDAALLIRRSLSSGTLRTSDQR
jgi:hypothetical protein